MRAGRTCERTRSAMRYSGARMPPHHPALAVRAWLTRGPQGEGEAREQGALTDAGLAGLPASQPLQKPVISLLPLALSTHGTASTSVAEGI